MDLQHNTFTSSHGSAQAATLLPTNEARVQQRYKVLAKLFDDLGIGYKAEPFKVLHPWSSNTVQKVWVMKSDVPFIDAYFGKVSMIIASPEGDHATGLCPAQPIEGLQFSYVNIETINYGVELTFEEGHHGQILPVLKHLILDDDDQVGNLVKLIKDNFESRYEKFIVEHGRLPEIAISWRKPRKIPQSRHSRA